MRVSVGAQRPRWQQRRGAPHHGHVVGRRGSDVAGGGASRVSPIFPAAAAARSTTLTMGAPQLRVRTITSTFWPTL